MTVVTRADHATSVSTLLADNTSGDISAGDLRSVITDLEDSVIWNDELGEYTVNPQTGTSYTLVLSDSGKFITMSNASANTLTIPTNASVAFVIGTTISITMLGSGTTTVTGATGVTVNGVSGGGATIDAQYKGVSITKIGSDTWVMQGAHGTVA